MRLCRHFRFTGGDIAMSVKGDSESECRECGSYNCENMFCASCLVATAVKFGADKDKLIEYLKANGQISDFEVSEVNAE
jgi:hypothetical protein